MDIKKLNEILVGWRNLVFPSKKTEELATKRIIVCVGCMIPNSEGVEEFGLNNKNTCVVCNCFMPAKVRNERSKCPLNKW